MKKLRHQNVLRLFEVIDDPKCNKLYLVLEYLRGGDLFTNEKLNDLQVWNIARQVIQGLAYLHMNNVIHGDIKPQNLLRDEDGRVKIADFGISTIINDNEKLSDTAGTPAFMCPELCAGKRYDGKMSDIYSLGATLYCLRVSRI